MEASAWSSGSGAFGIRVGVPNRDQHFDPSWTEIEVEIDGQPRTFALTPGFWNKCPEFRDSGGTVIRDWPTGEPPRFQLLPLGGGRFRLIGSEADGAARD